MVISIELQLRIVIFSLLAGIVTGVLFDLYRVFRGFNTNKIIMIIEDILFWILCSILIFVFLLYTNYAFVTPYVYLSIVIGILFYLKVMSRSFLKVEYGLIRNISQGLRVMFKYISYPFKIVFYKKYKNK